MSYSPDQWAAGLALAKVREPAVSSRAVLRSIAGQLLKNYGPQNVCNQVHYLRESEIAKWTGHEWRANARMSQKEARIAGMERAAKESPWLFSAGSLDLDPDVPPGPATFAPAHHVDTTKSRKVETPDASRARVTKNPLTGRVHIETNDDALLESARSVVRSLYPDLAGSAFFAEVTKHFNAMRDAQRASAKRDVTIPAQPKPKPVPVRGAR